MTPTVRRRASWALCLALIALLSGTSPAGAQTSGRIALDRPEVAPGEPVLVTVEGFDSPFVDVVLCGNLAYRGGSDCNVTAGVSKEIPTDGRARIVQLIAHPPPVPCPCIVRVTASTGAAFAVAPVTITGHPVAEPQGVPDGPLVEVEVETVRANDGFLAVIRSALGGSTRYETTVSVRNTTTAPLTKLTLSGSVGHWLDDDAATLELAPPGVLEPGETHTQQVVAEVPAPSVGDYTFEVVASGAGSTIADAVTARNKPVLLYLMVALFVGDLAMLATRWASRRRVLRDARETQEDGEAIEADWSDQVPVPGGPLPI